MSEVSKHGLMVIAVLSLLAPALLIAGCSNDEDEAPFATATVSRRNLEISAQAAGVIEPRVVVEVKSKASGEILEAPVETGDLVEKGALLVKVEQTEVRNNLAQAKADLEVARARLRRAEAELSRAQAMVESRVITAREFEQAELEEAEARAELIRAEAALETAQERFDETLVRAPMSGTVIRKDVEVGQVIVSATREVSGGTTLLEMADLRSVQVRTLVDETDVGKIRADLPAEVRVDAFPDRIFDGHVEKIEPQAEIQQNVTLFPTIIAIDNEELLLRPGMSADVTILVEQRRNVVAVPNQAVKPMMEAQRVAELALGLDRESFQQRLAEARSEGSDTGGKGSADSSKQPSNAPKPSQGSGWSRSDQGSRAGGPGQGGRGPGGPGHGGMRPGGGSRRSGSQNVVFIIDEGVLRPLPVQTGMTDYEFTEVLKGLKEGQEVALLPSASLLEDQARVRERLQSFQERSMPVSRRTN